MNALEADARQDPNSRLSKGLSYKLYCVLRETGAPAAKVYADWKAQVVREDLMDCVTHLVHIVVSMAVSVTVTHQVYKLLYIPNHKIWIESPSGDTAVQLPVFDALRVIRRKGWKFAEVMTVKTYKHLPEEIR